MIKQNKRNFFSVEYRLKLVCLIFENSFINLMSYDFRCNNKTEYMNMSFD